MQAIGLLTDKMVHYLAMGSEILYAALFIHHFPVVNIYNNHAVPWVGIWRQLRFSNDSIKTK